MDDAPGAPVIVSSHRTGAPILIAAGICTRCNRPTELGNLWDICTPCAAKQSSSMAAASYHHSIDAAASKARCAACRAPLRGPCQPPSFCPSCQARHAAVVKGKQVRNPYPRVPTALPSASVSAPSSAFVPSLYNAAKARPPLPAILTRPPLMTPPIPAHPRTSGVCMRFGCGARLLAHMGDMCEACARVGFVRPPPVALGPMEQRRVSKSAEQASPRPAEAVDLVRTSIMLGDERRDVTRAEGEDPDDESELELMYPDEDDVVETQDITLSTSDTSIVTQATSTSTWVPKTQQSKPVVDDKNGLELKYPEDAVKTKRVSRPRKRTKVPPPPTTLRELFQGDLQTIPVLQNLTSLVEKGPPRPCPSPGCNEVLPAQSGLRRCVKCSTAEWKRRRLTSIDTEIPRRRSTITTSTMEEREVVTLLEEMSDIEEENAVPPPSSSPAKDGMPGWDSDLTELSSSEASDSDTECTSDSSPEPDPKLAQLRMVPTGFKIRIPLLVTRLPPGSSFQKCANKRCHIALPKDHQWKTCDPCRNAQRMYQRLRLEKKRRSLLGMDTLDYSDPPWRRCRSLSPDYEMAMLDMDMSLTPETSRECAMKNCSNRIPLPEVYHWKTCLRCRANARNGARRKHDAPCDEVVPRFPAYQNRGQLMSLFESQLKGFVEGQILYYRAKIREDDGREPCRLEASPMMFVFAGEYSVVTGQRGDVDDTERERRPEAPDIAKDADVEAMRQEVSRVVLELGCVLRAKFRPGEAFAIDKGGIIMRFTCSLELIAQLRPLGSESATVTASAGNADGAGDAGGGCGPSSASVPDPGTITSKDDERSKDKNKDASETRPSPPPIPLMKTLAGELEVVVFPDESHRLFHGRRTVVRYRMVG